MIEVEWKGVECRAEDGDAGEKKMKEKIRCKHREKEDNIRCRWKESKIRNQCGNLQRFCRYFLSRASKMTSGFTSR